MKVTQVALRPTEASEAAGRPALTPELLAASGARYSRNNEGLEAILEKIDPANLDKSVDSIFRMIDYGHQSIADMAPVAMFVDGVSIWLAYLLWSLSPMAGGQESSTRYIKLSIEGLIPPETLGLPESQQAAWMEQMEAGFRAYQEALALWEGLVSADPQIARIPRSLLEDPSEKAKRQVARMKRNYGFDRARYFLPTAASTNLMLMMSARAWVQVCQHLLSHPLEEARRAGEAIREELRLAAPRLLKHATAKESLIQGIRQEFMELQRQALCMEDTFLREDADTCAHPPTASLTVLLPEGVAPETLADDLRHHDNRYGWVGPDLRRTAVRFGWEAVALAEIRDLNRHRTGTKHCPPIPRGFYDALDELPADAPERETLAAHLQTLSEVGRHASVQALEGLRAGEPTYLYGTLLGTQFPFEHVTTADKFLYEAELRTGTGAHYRYARHLHDALELWYTRFPETRGLVLEGSAEPE